MTNKNKLNINKKNESIIMLKILTITTESVVKPIIFPKGKMKEVLADLRNKIEEAKGTTDFRRLFDVIAQFYRYSFRNTLLIFYQFPDATLVAGYRQWQNKWNRQVRKGEKGIRILAPLYKTVTDEVSGDETSKLVGFRVVSVFDIAQTDPIPGRKPLDIPDPIALVSPDEQNTDIYYKKLTTYIKERDIPVGFKPLGLSGGYTDGKKIVLSTQRNPTGQFFTMIHEYTHYNLHWKRTKEGKLIQDPDYSREKKELEAEAVAYIVAKQLGFDYSKMLRYLAAWQNKENITESLDNVYKISAEIIQVLADDDQIIDMIGP
jgi:Zn-dependent peptidase ImmA (M78 family)